jgi:hypothetical protein
LYLIFGLKKNRRGILSAFNWQESVKRQEVIAWLDNNSMPWVECAGVASENSMCGYLGSIYIDIPFDTSNAEYQKLRDYLEFPDETMRHKDVAFAYLPLAHAMKNAHHDEPGFWEELAKDF